MIMENTVTVEISYSGRNFGAWVPVLPGCVATGATPDEIKKNIEDAIAFHVEGSLKDNDEIPSVFKRKYHVGYKFDTESLLNYYKGIFTNSALERVTGINQKQLQHYSSGLKKPRPAQTKKIEAALHKLGSELMAVEL
jgi:predicted RNase H-like HicB family nuclease